MLVNLASQLLFAFEWQEPETTVKTQCCWTVLPQGLKNSPTIWGKTVSKDLEELQFQKGVLLQHVDDLLITGPTYEACLERTFKTLHHLADCGYKVSSSKAQICSQAVMPLAYSSRKRSLIRDRKETVIQKQSPRTRRQLRGFQGMLDNVTSESLTSDL